MTKEPPTNTSLEPLVNDLLSAWHHGFKLIGYNRIESVYRLALICAGCDIPAARKLFGFIGKLVQTALNTLCYVYTCMSSCVDLKPSFWSNIELS